MNNLELLADALAYMEENLCETITAEAAARNCFCSKYAWKSCSAASMAAVLRNM